MSLVYYQLSNRIHTISFSDISWINVTTIQKARSLVDFLETKRISIKFGMLLINLRDLKPIVLLAFDIPFAQLTPDTDVMGDGDFFGRGYFANVVASVLGFSQRNHQPITSLAFLLGMH